MTINAINQLASVSVTPVETVTWETASDWDSAQSEDNVDHLSTPTEVRMGYFDDFESGTASFWTTVGSSVVFSTTTTGSRVASGSQALIIDGDTNGNDKVYADIADDAEEVYISMWFQLEDDDRIDFPEVLDIESEEQSDAFNDAASNEYFLFDGTRRKVFTYFPDTYYWGEWRWIDTNDGMECFVYDAPGGNLIGSYQDLSSNRAFGPIDAVQFRPIGGRIYIDDFYALAQDTATLTTATKTFSGPTQPDLSDLDYDLNGESVTIDVTGSPGGTPETVSQSLDGSTSYALSWSSSHTTFEVELNYSTSDVRNTPVVRSVTLQGGV